MKKNFRKAGPASLTLLFATVLAAALVFAGCSSSSDDSGDSIKSSATVFPIEQTFTPEPGANFLTVELNGGSFKKDVSLSDFAFGETQTRSSTFGTNLSNARLTKGDVGDVFVFGTGGEAGVLTKVYITGLTADDIGVKSGVQTLTIKASALAVQPVPIGTLFPNGVHVETGTTRDIVIGPFKVDVVEADVLTLDIARTGQFVETPILSDFELLQKDGERTGYYKAYDVAANGGFANLSGATVVRDFPWEIRFNGLPKSVRTDSTSAYLLVRASAQAKQIVGTISPVTTMLTDDSTPLYLAPTTTTPKFTFGKTLTKDPQDWIGYVDAGKTQVTVVSTNAVFKPQGRLSLDYFVFDNVPGGFTKGKNTAIAQWAPGSIVLSGLEPPTKQVEQRLTVLKEAFSYWDPTKTIANPNSDIDINPFASGNPVIESAQYAMTLSNLLTVELPAGGQFITADSLAKRISTDTKNVTYEADPIPEAESEGGVWGWVINLPFKMTANVSGADVSSVFPAGGTGTFTQGIPGKGAIRRIRMSIDRTKLELYKVQAWPADNIDNTQVQTQKSTLVVDSKIVEAPAAGSSISLSITSGKEALKVPFTVGAEGANTLTVSVTLDGTSSGSLSGKLFDYQGRDWQTVSVVDAVSRVEAAKVPVRVAFDGTVLYGVIPTPLAAGNYLAVVGGELQRRLEQKTYVVNALSDGSGPVALVGSLFVGALPTSLDGTPYTRVWAVAGTGTAVTAPLVSPVNPAVPAPTNAGDNTLSVTLSGGTFRGWEGYGAGTAAATQPQRYDVGSLVRVTDFAVDGTEIKAGKVILVSANEARIYGINPALPAGGANVTVKAEAIARTVAAAAPNGTASSALSVRTNFKIGTDPWNLIVTLEGGTWANDGTAAPLPIVGTIDGFFTTVREAATGFDGDNPDYILVDTPSIAGTANTDMWGDNKVGTRLVVNGLPSDTPPATLARSVKWNTFVYLTIPNVDGIIVRDGTPAKLTAKQQ